MISLAPINPLSGNKMSFAYYNEIVPQVGAEVVRAYMECRP